MALPFKPKRLLSEEDVKHMLGIENFRQLDKKTTIEFISSISQMDPEVAVKALPKSTIFIRAIKGSSREIWLFSQRVRVLSYSAPSLCSEEMDASNSRTSAM